MEGGKEMKAAIYCRVSTEDQEREGTSLDSQLEACQGKAQELGYEISKDYTIRETYSGLSLDRPKLNQLRDWVRDKQVDAVIAYTLDRLSRDPVHFIILQEELEKSGVEIVLVTEDMDTSDMGKLITHIRGFAAKLEAQKIRERTLRGIKERIKSGKLPGGQRSRLYGYLYIPGKGEGQGIRVINENEAKWVRNIYTWYAHDEMTIYSIAMRLRKEEVPTPSGKGPWGTSTVHKILINPAYCGKTYAFTITRVDGGKHHKPNPKQRNTHRLYKPADQWIEIPNVTPPIVSEELFSQVQARLDRNKIMAGRNKKRQYLLSGYVFCQRCGRRYGAGAVPSGHKEGRVYHRYYQCPKGFKIISPIQCTNRRWRADTLENLVWEQIEEVLSKPELIFAELERRKEGNQPDVLAREVMDFKLKLSDMDREQERLLQWAMKGFPEDAVIRENEKINRYRAELQKHINDLQERIERVKQVQFALQDVEKFCETARQNLPNFTYEDKRLALAALQVEVWLDGDNVSIKGFIPSIAVDDTIASTLLRQTSTPVPTPHPFSPGQEYHRLWLLQGYSSPWRTRRHLPW
jgi:site-specific DNA recombinase